MPSNSICPPRAAYRIPGIANGMVRVWARCVAFTIVWVFCTRGIQPFVVTKTPSDVEEGKANLSRES